MNPSCQPLVPVDGMGSNDGFVRLVLLAARTFYSDIRGSTGDIADVLNALTRHQWVKEKELAKELKMKRKELEPILHFLEDESFIRREIPRKRCKTTSVATTADRPFATKDRKEAIKINSNSHCCLDYAKVYDAVKYRILVMTQELKNQLNMKSTIQQYKCTDCEKSYSALDALQLCSPIDDNFHCEKCDKNLVVVGDSGEIHERSLDMLRKMEEELKPLSSLVNNLKGVATPKFITLQEWKGTIMYENAAAATIPPVSLIEAKSIETSTVPIAQKMKELPTWLIKGEGSNLTQEQRKFLSEFNVNRKVGVKSKRHDDI